MGNRNERESGSREDGLEECRETERDPRVITVEVWLAAIGFEPAQALLLAEDLGEFLGKARWKTTALRTEGEGEILAVDIDNYVSPSEPDERLSIYFYQGKDGKPAVFVGSGAINSRRQQLLSIDLGDEKGIFVREVVSDYRDFRTPDRLFLVTGDESAPVIYKDKNGSIWAEV